MGCKVAESPISQFAEEEPDDVQMVYFSDFGERLLGGYNEGIYVYYIDGKT